MYILNLHSVIRDKTVRNVNIILLCKTVTYYYVFLLPWYLSRKIKMKALLKRKFYFKNLCVLRVLCNNKLFYTITVTIILLDDKLIQRRYFIIL